MTRAQKHLAKIARLGCIVCRRAGLGESPAEVHHIGDSAERSDYLTIPLCPIHHRLGGLGVAYHAGPKAFEAAHASEIALLAETLEQMA